MFKKLSSSVFSQLICLVFLACATTTASAKSRQYKDVYKDMVCRECALSYPHWYVAGNIGVSHLFDDESAGTSNSVDQNGPGWDATFGYQYNRMFGGEIGYTQYYNSRETSGSTVVARTSHFATHLNATGRYGFATRFNLLAKLGIAYSYAQKIFEATGAAGSSGAVSLYYGVGLTYNLTERAEVIAQWARAVGNDYTGSSDLYSLGLSYAIG